METLDSYDFRPHQFVGEMYRKYQSKGYDSPSINGRIFELLIAETLAQADVTPFYYQANFQLVPNADFDILLYDPREPVILTMKTTLRERYKQADLEGLVLKQVYRHAKSYLITLSEGEADSVNSKIEKGDVTGLERCIIASSEEYSEFIDHLKNITFGVAELIQPVTKGTIIVGN